MFCVKCGQKLNDDAVFCVKCGNQIRSSQPAGRPAGQPVTPPPMMAPLVANPVAQKKSKAPLVLGICGFLFVVSITVGVLFATGVLSFSGDKKGTSPATDPNMQEASIPSPDTQQATEAPAAVPTEEPIETSSPGETLSPVEPTDEGPADVEEDPDPVDPDEDLDEDEEEQKPRSAKKSWKKKYKNSRVYPEGKYYELDEYVLTGWDKDQILHLDELKGLSRYNKFSIVLNSMYARHGYKFKTNKGMRAFFKSKKWYKRKRKNVDLSSKERENEKTLFKWRGKKTGKRYDREVEHLQKWLRKKGIKVK